MKLAAYLQMVGKTNAQFARDIDVSRATISLLQGNKRKPSLSMIAKIMAATKGNVTATDFMEEPDGF